MEKDSDFKKGGGLHTWSKQLHNAGVVDKVNARSAKSKALGKKKVRDFAFYEKQDKKWTNKAK